MKKIVFIASNHKIRRSAVQIFSRVLSFTLFLANIFTYICIFVHVCLYNNQVGSSHCLESLMVKTLGPFLGYSGWHWQGELEETN